MPGPSSCWFCINGLRGPAREPLVRCPSCGALVPNRRGAGRRALGALAGRGGAGLLVALVVAIGIAVVRPARRDAPGASYAHRAVSPGGLGILSAAPSAPSRASAAYGGLPPGTTMVPGLGWPVTVRRERLSASAFGSGSNLIASRDPFSLPSTGARGGDAYDVQIASAGPFLHIEAPGEMPEREVQALARQKAQEIKARYGVDRVRVSGARQGNRYQVVVEPVGD